MPSFLNRVPWRSLISTLSLPMLTLSGSFGVYEFSHLFSPTWVSLANAAAFEWVYLGLAVARLPDEQRSRATLISRAAVAVSIFDNFVAGMLHLQPDLQQLVPLWAAVGLSLLHSIPLGVLAYATSDLLIHTPPPAESALPITPTAELPPPEPTYACPSCSAPLRKAELGAAKRYGYCGACKATAQARQPKGAA